MKFENVEKISYKERNSKSRKLWCRGVVVAFESAISCARTTKRSNVRSKSNTDLQWVIRSRNELTHRETADFTAPPNPRVHSCKFRNAPGEPGNRRKGNSIAPETLLQLEDFMFLFFKIWKRIMPGEGSRPCFIDFLLHWSFGWIGPSLLTAYCAGIGPQTRYVVSINLTFFINSQFWILQCHRR